MFTRKVNNLAKKTNGKLIIKEYPTGSAHSGHFRALLNELKLKRQFVPDMIFLDYLNINLKLQIKMGDHSKVLFIFDDYKESIGMLICLMVVQFIYTAIVWGTFLVWHMINSYIAILFLFVFIISFFLALRFGCKKDDEDR